MELIAAIKITCEILSELSSNFISSLEELGIDKYNVKPGRSVSLLESESFLFGIKKTKLEENPTDIYDFLINPKDESKVLNFLISQNELDIPGRGSIYSTEISIATKIKFNPINTTKNVEINEKNMLLNKLIGIRCIVQTGKAITLVKAALKMGVSVPVITLGEGAGLRDRLGLLRITIPAEKEIVHFVVHENDASKIIEEITQASKIYDMGNGYIYTYPIHHAMLNTKIYRGKENYAASMDQIIAQLDKINGSTDWRQRFSKHNKSIFSNSKIRKDSDLIDINLSCNEGTTINLIKHTLNHFGTGATISRYRMHLKYQNPYLNQTRECSYMTIKSSIKNNLIEILENDHYNNIHNGAITEFAVVLNAYSYKR